MFLIISVALSSLFLILINIVVVPGKRGAIRTVFLVSGASVVFGLCIFQSIPFALNVLLVGIAGFICLAVTSKRRLFLTASLAATAVTYAIFFASAIAEVMEWARLKQYYPYESLVSRLGIELRRETTFGKDLPEVASSAVSSKQEPPHIPDIRLAAIENEIDRKGWAMDNAGRSAPLREASLMHLHAGFVEQFINTPGFGPARMIDRPSPRSLELLEAEPIPLPPPVYEDPSLTEETLDSPQSPPISLGPDNSEMAANSFEKFHQDGLVDFFNPQRFGYVKDLDHVAGFQVHQFSEMPHVEKQRWIIQNLELVSLLKHKEPAVYLSDHLPRMDKLRHAPTRPLDAFEKSALAALRKGEDLKVRNSKDRLRILGSLRAVKQCLTCHQAKRGDLLGAFTYKLRRDPSSP